MTRCYDGGRMTGFVSPASDAIEDPIDLSEILDLTRPHRYPVRVVGQALCERGIYDGDVLITGASAPPARGRVCVAMVRGDVILATLAYRAGVWWRVPCTARDEPVLAVTDAQGSLPWPHRNGA